MNNENINENEQNLNDNQFDALVNNITRHSINKKHSPERLYNIVQYAIEENRNYEKDRKIALSHLNKKTNQSKAKEFMANLVGWGRPKVLIPRLAFLASILIIVSVSIFYLSSPQNYQETDNIVSIKKEEVIKQDEQKPESKQTEIEVTQETNILQDKSNSTTKSHTDKSHLKFNNLSTDNESTFITGTEPPADPSLGSKIEYSNSLPRMPNAPVSQTNTNRGYDYLSHNQIRSFDTILETIVDSERGGESFGLFSMSRSPKGDNNNLNFIRYVQILNNYQIPYIEKENEIITNWFLVKSKNSASSYLRLLFNYDSTNTKNIYIIKESTEQISDTSNIRILTEKEYIKLINLLK